jgi:iron-sulfur cluster insertion protein
MTIDITPAAKNRIEHLNQTENLPYFRIRIDSGGCSGFQYHFEFDAHKSNTDDVEIDCVESVSILIDKISLGLIEKSTLDFFEDLAGSAFVLKNPNAASSCGCGNSFSL